MTKLNFKDYGLSSKLLKAIELLNYQIPSKVQQEVIPVALQGKDIVVRSQTGSGKTAAFGIPICQLVKWAENKPQALVITPTRELAIQVREDVFNIGRFKRLKVLAVYGKAPFYNQERELKQKTHVVVGTPGRIIDHIESGTLDTSGIRYLVIDEADEMFNMGFIDQIESIIRKLSKKRITMLFSATMPADVKSLCYINMREPVFVDIESVNLTVDRIKQERYTVEEPDKKELLKDLTILENPDSCIVFCNTRERVDEVYAEMKRNKYSCDKIHGGMEQKDRLERMENFKKGNFRYLIATDVAARGIDVENITHIFNYDIPREKEAYVHRIGRTGRKDRSGKAITLVTNTEEKYLNEICDYIERDIPLKERPEKDVINNLRSRFYEKMSRRPEPIEQKAKNLNKGILKLHINAGKKTKMRAVDIVGTICNIEGMKAEDIGIINILDTSTFVEILNNKGEMVFQALQNKPMKGRLRNVSKADE